MGYIEDNLIPGERVLLRSSPHWVLFVMPLATMVLGIAVIAASLAWESMSFTRCLGVVLFLSGTIGIGPIVVAYLTTEFALTDLRIIAKAGLLSRRSLELQLAKVESIQVTQPLAGRIFDYGTVTVVGTGGTKQAFKFIGHPHELRREVNSKLASLA